MSKAEQPATLEVPLIGWAAIHGCLCLALRHPKNTGPTRELVEHVLKGIEVLLVEGGLFTQAEMDHAHHVERELGTTGERPS